MTILAWATLLSLHTTPSTPALDEPTAARFARLALACVHKEYPGKISHVLNGPADVRSPRQLTPAFFGCYDWHSSVHGHWLLVRLARTFPDASFTRAALKALEGSLTPAKIAAEVRYLEAPGRVTFERPYGLAWLLQLSAELREWNDPRAQRWAKALQPLESAAVQRFKAWLPKLTNPIRGGEHEQTAFAFGLVLDWAKTAQDAAMGELLRQRIEHFYGQDRACPIRWEPSGQDFLSPCLGEADLMRRVMPAERYATWLSAFLPELPSGLEPAVVLDRSDPKLAHLDGLNLSRAWMLEGILSALPPGDPRRGALEKAAEAHRKSGLEAVTGEHYEGGHWLGSFAAYLTTRRGI
jgi:hypothetical protein